MFLVVFQYHVKTKCNCKCEIRQQGYFKSRIVHGIDIKGGHVHVAEQHDNESDDKNYQPRRNIFVLFNIFNAVPGNEVACQRGYQNPEQAYGKRIRYHQRFDNHQRDGYAD